MVVPLVEVNISMPWMEIVKGVLIFFAAFMTDAVWTIYIKAAAENQALKAASASAVLAIIGGGAVWFFIHNPWLLIPEVLGGFAGTWVVIKRNIKKELARPAE